MFTLFRSSLFYSLFKNLTYVSHRSMHSSRVQVASRQLKIEKNKQTKQANAHREYDQSPLKM